MKSVWDGWYRFTPLFLLAVMAAGRGSFFRHTEITESTEIIEPEGSCSSEQIFS
jgi:hypothetical protein